jgi:hypothetical protein
VDAEFRYSLIPITYVYPHVPVSFSKKGEHCLPKGKTSYF